jgi:hypothetical protein
MSAVLGIAAEEESLVFSKWGTRDLYVLVAQGGPLLSALALEDQLPDVGHEHSHYR